MILKWFLHFFKQEFDNQENGRRRFRVSPILPPFGPSAMHVVCEVDRKKLHEQVEVHNSRVSLREDTRRLAEEIHGDREWKKNPTEIEALENTRYAPVLAELERKMRSENEG